jgi:hypothetical protein
LLGGEPFDFATTTHDLTVIELDRATGRARIGWIDAGATTVESLEYERA